MSTMLSARHFMGFHSAAVDANALVVLSMQGDEALSRPYQWDIELLAKDANLDLKKLIKEAAYLALRTGVTMASGSRAARTVKIHGVLSSFRAVEQRGDLMLYKARLHPRLWKLSLSYQSRCFLEKTVPEIVEEVLKEAGFGGTDYELRLKGKYAAREFVMQYEETDLDFIHRWMEHEGIFYYFLQSDAESNGDKIVFCDHADAYEPLPGLSSLLFRQDAFTETKAVWENEDSWYGEETIQRLSCDQRQIPKKVILSDYNWRQPSQPLKVESDVDSDGVGTVYEYNNHYKSQDEGKTLAKTRAEELLCRRTVFNGRSDCKSFFCGGQIEIKEHPRKDFNKPLAIVSVRHFATQEIDMESGNAPGAAYHNEFTAIPAATVFRPERVTRWPSIAGIMHAKVDAGGGGEYAEIDDMGRYKVKLPLDLSDRSSGKASRYVRMAQPYAGGGMGMHFPLHKGTEVILSFIDGDPDRPIISGAVPNPETASPVTGGNQTQCKIQTGGGNKIVIEDQDGNQRIKMECPTSGTMLQMGSKNLDVLGFGVRTLTDMLFSNDGNRTETTGGNWTQQISGWFDTHIVGYVKEHYENAKIKFVGGIQETVILGGKAEQITLFDNKTILGWKGEQILGLITTIGKAAKYEKIKTKALQQTTSTTMKATTDITLDTRAITLKAGNNVDVLAKSSVLIKVGDNVSTEMGVNQIKSIADKNIILEGKSLVQITTDAEMKTGSKNTHFKANEKMFVEGADVEIKGSSETKMTGGKLTVEIPATFKKEVNIDGKLDVHGALTVD